MPFGKRSASQRRVRAACASCTSSAVIRARSSSLVKWGSCIVQVDDRRHYALTSAVCALPFGALALLTASCCRRPCGAPPMRKDPKVRKLIATSVLLLCAAAAGSAAGSQAHADTASIVGIWTLNKDASDAPPERTNRDDRERGGGGAGHGGGSVGGFGRGGGRGGPGGADPDAMRRRIQAMRDILDAP